MPRTTAHTGRRASVYEGNPNQRGKKRGRSMILTDSLVKNALEGEKNHQPKGGENIRSEEISEIC